MVDTLLADSRNLIVRFFGFMGRVATVNKTCSTCGVSQPSERFSRRAASPDGLGPECKPCTSESKKRQRATLRARSDEEIESTAALRPPRACRICKVVKTPDEFPRDRGRRDGRGTVCLPCSAELTRHYNDLLDPAELKRRKAEHYRKYRAKYRRYRLKANFGLEDYEAMSEAQGGVCAICKKPETVKYAGVVKNLAVDHCHASDNIRELLCSNCNHGLGHFKDSPDLLRDAAHYLEKHAVTIREEISV